MTDMAHLVYTTSIDGVHICPWIDLVYDGHVVYTIDLGTTFTPIADLAKVLSEHGWDLVAGNWYDALMGGKRFIGGATK